MKYKTLKIISIIIMVLGVLLIGYGIYSFYIDNKNNTISFEENNLILEINEKAMLNIKNKDNEEYEWKSSDYSVVMVNDNGEVTALKKGTATITVISGTKKAQCLIIVTDNRNNQSSQEKLPESISFNSKI